MHIPYGFKATDMIDEGRLTEKDMDELKVWLKEQDDIPDLTDEQIVLFLLSCNNVQKETRNTIRAYYDSRQNAPELFNSRCLTRNDLKQQLEVLEYSVFPERTKEGYAIIFHRLHNTSFSMYSMEPAMKLLFMTLDSALYDHPPKGLVFLFDMKGVGLMHLTRLNIGAVRKFFYYLQEGLPLQLKGIHVMNVVYFFDKILGIIKPFMKKELWDMLHIHNPGCDMDQFYEENLPKRCMPEDYGGDLPNTRDLHQVTCDKLDELKHHFDAEEMQRQLI